MQSRLLCTLICLLMLATSALSAQTAHAVPRYVVTDLGQPGSYSEAEALNNRGQAVGWQGTGERVIAAGAMLWQNGTGQALTKQPFEGAHGINDAGQIVGIPHEMFIIGTGRFDILSGASAFVWDQGYLSYLSGDSAWAINSQRQIAGASGQQAVIWQSRPITGLLAGKPDVIWPGIRPHRLGQLAGYSFSAAYGLNDSGEAVGVVLKNLTSVPEHGRAFRYLAGKMSLLRQPAQGNSVAYAINSGGTTVGMFEQVSPSWRAVVWNADGSLVPLPPLGGFFGTVAHGINATGQVVGWAFQQNYSPATDMISLGDVNHPKAHACLWQGQTVYDLNGLIPADSGWVLQKAAAISDKGWIVGGGSIHGEYHAFLLTPVVVP